MNDKIRQYRGALAAMIVSAVAAGYAVVPSMAAAEGTSLGEAFKPGEVATELLDKLGPVGVAVVTLFVAVFLFSVGLAFFRRHGKSVAK